VVAIGPLAQNLEPGVDLGEGAKAKCLWQGERAAGRPSVRPARSLVEMAPRAKRGAGSGR
jgi:hypothetical protein